MSFRRNPWEWLYERQATPLKSYVLDEVAKTLAKAVESFPPEIEEWADPAAHARFDELVRVNKGRPTIPCIRIAIRLYRWEIAREYELIDAYVKGGHWASEGAGQFEYDVAHFLWQYWLDQTLALLEYAAGKFKRAEMQGIADRLESMLGAAPDARIVN